jgi:ABC-type phosphonate transport system ATPase subunit
MSALQNGVDNPDFDYWSDEYVPVRKGISDWLAEYFEIDQVRLDDEKRAMLAALRDAA